MAQVAVATEPSKRSSTGTSGTPSLAARIVPSIRLRLVPTTTGKPVATRSPSRPSRARLWCRALPKPIPGSIHTSSHPAATAASARATRKSLTSVTTSS